jgi:hypothetical protein
MTAHEMTAVLPGENGPRLVGDRIYFTGFSLLVLSLIFWAFAPTYFLASAYHKPAPPPFIVVHGAMMTGWILLLLAQSILAATRRISWHMKVGNFGFAYAAILVPIGCMAVTTSAAREVQGHTSFMLGELNVLGISLTQMILFGGFAGAAYLLRRRVDYHKRLVVLATLSVLPNAVVRLGQNVPAFGYIQTNLDILNTWAVFALFVIVVDALRTRRLHPAFMVGGSLVFVALYLSWLISRTPAWDQFWIHSLT